MIVKDRRLLKRIMAINGVTQRELAGAMGLSRNSASYVNRLLSGECTTITPDRAALIAEYLKVGLDDLFLPRAYRSSEQPVQRKRKRRAA